MITRVMLFGLLLIPAPLMAQTPPQENRDKQARRDDGSQDRPDRDARREARRAERRQRWDRYNNATPAERSQMRVDRLVEMTARTYELDESQKVMVRQEILQMQAERRVAMGADAEELDKLREKMGQFWRSQQDAGGGDADSRPRRDRRREIRSNPELREIRDKMRALEDKYPIDWDAAAKRVEALLPPEQAEKGRARRAEREARWQDRRGNRDRRRGEARSNVNGRVAGDSIRNQSITQAEQRVPPATEQAQSGNGTAPVAAIHPWESYTNEFISHHGLTPAQTNSAKAILHDLMQRSAQFESSISDRLAEAEKIVDAVSRKKRIADLTAPNERLFDELKTRLDGLLTAAQRQATGK